MGEIPRFLPVKLCAMQTLTTSQEAFVTHQHSLSNSGLPK